MFNSCKSTKFAKILETVIGHIQPGTGVNIKSLSEYLENISGKLKSHTGF